MFPFFIMHEYAGGLSWRKTAGSREALTLEGMDPSKDWSFMLRAYVSGEAAEPKSSP